MDPDNAKTRVRFLPGDHFSNIWKTHLGYDTFLSSLFSMYEDAYFILLLGCPHLRGNVVYK